MKRSQITDLFTTIKATAVSFFSIVMFVALAIAIFLGIEWSGGALGAAGEQVFEEGRFHDVEILFPYGLTDYDAEQLQQLEGVDEVEIGHVAFSTVTIGSVQYNARVNQLGTNVDKAILTEGTLPSAQGQIAFETYWAARHNVSVGDVVVLGSTDSEASEETASPAAGEYTVTALVDDPSFISASANTWGASNSSAGSVETLVWVCPDSFSDVSGSIGNRAVLRSNALRSFETFSSEYDEAAEALVSSVKELGSKLAEKRHDDLVKEAEDKLSESQSELADAREEIGEAEQQLADAETQLNEGKQQLSDGEQQLASGQSQYNAAVSSGKQQLDEAAAGLSQLRETYNSASSQLESGKTEYATAKATFEEKQAQFDEAKRSYDAAVEELETQREQCNSALALLDEEERSLSPDDPDYAEKIAAIEAQRKELLAKMAEIDAAQKTLDEKKEELDSWSKELEAAKEQLSAMEASIDEAEANVAALGEQLKTAEQEYATAEAEYSAEVSSGAAQLSSAYTLLEEKRTELSEAETEIGAKREDLDDAKSELSRGESELSDAEEQLEQLKESTCSWTVFGRAENGGVVSMRGFIDIAGRLRTSMASLFVIVGLLVCYSAIARLVREHVRQIGTKKALGMRAREITAAYLMYSGAAVLIGCVAGVLAAVFIVERIIVPVLASSFFMPAGIWWDTSQAALFCLLELVLILASTWLACRSVLRRHAVELLAGGKPPSPKERFFEKWNVWKSLPLYTQSTVNNLLNDKRRVLGTIVGVAGCTALVVCAVTLNNDVIAGFNRQYSDVYHYDTIVRTDLGEDGARQAEELVTEQGCDVLASVSTRAVSVSLPDGSTSIATITIPDDNDAFAQAVTLIPTSGGQAVIGTDGVWVSNSYAEHQGAKPGDFMSVTAGDGSSYQLPIVGFYQHYLSGYQVVMSKELYEEIFGIEAVTSKLLVNRGNVDYDALKSSVESSECIAAVADDKADQEALFNSFRKVSRVVVMVYLALSVAMAIVVLLNLNFMFVEEKRRDLITLMVCGYSISDAKRYIWRDNVILTILGIVIGVLLGMVTGWLAVLSMELSTMSLVKSPDMIACLMGILVSGVLSTAMTFVALRRVAKLELSDINA